MSIHFDRAAGFYDETRGFPPGEEDAVAALFQQAGDLTPDSRVLDVGTGTGRIALPLATHVRAIAGIDLSRRMLARLCAKRTDQPVHGVHGDATRLPFALSVFDAATAVHVFHLIPDWQGALREIARVLKPGGRLLEGYNSNPRSPHDAILWAAWDAVVGPLKRRNVGVTREEYDTFLVDAGWRPVGGPHVHTFTTIQTPQMFVGRLERRVWSSTWRLDDTAVERGIAAVRAAMAEHQIDPHAPTELEAQFTVRAYKPPMP